MNYRGEDIRVANELKATVINMKTLSQDITDPVVVGAGEAAGRALRIIFTQEAAARFTPNTKVYLSWYHQEKNIKGYNVFTEITNEDDEDFPPTWEIKYPKSMLYEGNVLACIQIVDEVSISTSVNFTIHVLIDPNDGSDFEETDDFTEFQKAVVSLATLEDQVKDEMQAQRDEFADMQLAFEDIRQTANEAKDLSEEAKQISENALGIATEALETIEDFTTLAHEIQEKEQTNEEAIQELRDAVDDAINRTDNIAENVADVAAAVREVAEKIGDIKCECGLDEDEVLALIEQELANYVTQDQIANYATIQQLAGYVTQDQIQEYATLGEVDEKLSVAVEEAQGEHDELWAAMQFVDYSGDGE